MSTHVDVIPRLRQALQAAGHPGATAALERLPDKGLAHDHVRLAGSGVLARMPKQSQMGWTAADNLAYQRACFERAAVGGHAPVCHGVLPPSAPLPRGALLVQEVEGRTARLPADLGAVARALAALHALPVPESAQRAPLLDPPDPLQALCEEIATQAGHLAAAGLTPPVARTIEAQWQRLQALRAEPGRPGVHLIAFDAHPGNFIVQPDGRAVLVDLEKCRYGYPGLDLAHATLYTSTTGTLRRATPVLSPGRWSRSKNREWAQAVGRRWPLAAQAWHLPLRRAMWLWSVTWCAKWRVTSGARASAVPDGEDWSSEHSEAALVAHVRERVDHYLSEAVVSTVVDEFNRLERELSA